MIVMLDYLEIDTEVLDIYIEITKSNDCKEMSEDNRDANGMLAMIWEGERSFHRDK